jgi:N-methylhydantoinase B/oxoprolinase/acetone carboxylase alpha subunit
MVQRDVVEGYVSAERAKSEYGVVIDTATGEIDGEETRKIREGSRGRGPGSS